MGAVLDVKKRTGRGASLRMILLPVVRATGVTYHRTFSLRDEYEVDV